jgi:tryptophan 2,3-dioxygenase
MTRPSGSHHHALPAALTYSDYINDRAMVEGLVMLPAPAGVSPGEWPDTNAFKPGDDWPEGGAWCHDEVLFIRTHQAFEVWFALIMHELNSVIRAASRLWPGGVPAADLGKRAEAPALRPIRLDRWPLTKAAIAEVAARSSAAGEILAQIAEPMQMGLGAALPPGMGEGAAFNQLLSLGSHRLGRATQAMLCTIPFFDVLATLTPAEFLRFRGRLSPASGFGSVQFRELELTVGLRELHAAKIAPEGGEPTPHPPILRPGPRTPPHAAAMAFHTVQPVWGIERLARRLNQPSLRDLVYALLSAAASAGRRADGPEHGLPDMRDPAVDRLLATNLRHLIGDHFRGAGAITLDDTGAAHLRSAVADLGGAFAQIETVAAAMIAMHPAQERFTLLLEAALDLDAALLRWRDRHIRFVEHIIGMRRGTGGGGIQYLRGTTSAARPAHLTHGLPALWQARSFVQTV